MTTQLRLSQALATTKLIQARVTTEHSDLHHRTQKADLLNGFIKTYQRTDEASIESKRVQLNASEAIAAVFKNYVELCDSIATKDYGNTEAKADVTVNGQVLIKAAPPTFLMFLHKQLEDCKTFLSKIDVLDQSHDWTLDDKTNLWKSAAAKTNSTDKIQAALTLVPPTDKHPGQAVQITKDTVVGVWTTIQVSGAIPYTRRQELLARIETLMKAVDSALSECNSAKIDRKEVTAPLFAFLNA
jgi:antirestriction protein